MTNSLLNSIPYREETSLAEAHADSPDRATISPADLAELIASFSEVTTRLEATHDQLRAEVGRLNAELSNANEQLERSRRLAALGEMAAGIAHEVRNPLGCIRLYARMLDQDLADRPGERQTVRKIDAAACGLDAIVGDVLTFSKEFSVRAAACDAIELVTQSLEACCHDGVRGWRDTEIVRADIQRASRDPSGVPELYVDRGLAQQALVNVVRNALEAADEAACKEPARARSINVDVFSRECADDRGETRRFGVISVRDSGPGVPPEVVARMFNPFFTTRATGTGLGLAIVHRIIDAHAGMVRVLDSAACNEGPEAERRGATFELLFPEPRPKQLTACAA